MIIKKYFIPGHGHGQKKVIFFLPMNIIFNIKKKIINMENKLVEIKKI